MPNGILGHNNSKKRQNGHNNKKTSTMTFRETNDGHLSSSKFKTTMTTNTQTIGVQQPPPPPQSQPSTNILNVAEMILHGVKDDEILDNWLKSIACQEFVGNFIDAGYDMPTLSRITPQDLTAIGIIDPAKRLKLLSEIKKLNLQDGIPNFRPASLSHWLSLIRLDNIYYKSLCDQQIDTIEKMCQLTWEDFEELGISKLGHQKRLQLAIEKMKEIEANDNKSAKPMSEPIYDTNPSQILLVASAENHSMNGPIINKQSSTGELSSTGSGSMHSVYSASSSRYQPTYASIQQQQQQQQHQQQPNDQQNIIQQQQTQPIYSQPPQVLHQQQITRSQHPQPAQQMSHYQSMQHQQSQFISGHLNPTHVPGQLNKNDIGLNGNGDRNNVIPPPNRQSFGHLPFALANLPKHQQQLLQQSSIYATLSRQPQRAKKTPPPVPIRTNSLKNNSLFDNDTSSKQQPTNYQSTQQLNNFETPSASTLFRSGTRVSTRNNNTQFNSQTMLNKNKSFSGNAHMDAIRARFLNRNGQHQFGNLPQQIKSLLDQNIIDNRCNQNRYNNIAHQQDGDNLSVYSRQSIVSDGMMQQPNLPRIDQTLDSLPSQLQRLTGFIDSQQTSTGRFDNNFNSQQALGPNAVNFDPQSDTNSTKSLIITPNTDVNSLNDNDSSTNESPGHGSGSSQTLYNSASSGSSNDQNNLFKLSQGGRSTTSSSTLNDINLTNFEQQNQRPSNLGETNSFSTTLINKNYTANDIVINRPSNECNATTGRDDDFPPPPSPLSLTDSDEHDIVSLNSDANFLDISHGLMTFRVGS